MYDFVCIDFETANRNMNSACSIGIVAVKDLKIIATDYFLIKPPDKYFGKKNIEIHGITLEDVKDCLDFTFVYPKLKSYIDNSSFLIAHNAHFDMTVLHETSNYYGIEVEDFLYIDSINFSSKVKNSGGNSLVACAEYFGVDIKNHHNALDDSMTCAKIIIKSIEESKYDSFFTYIKRYPSIHKNHFCDLKSAKQMVTKKKYESVKISEITAAKECFDENHPLYKKNCVLTGELQFLSRRDAMQKIVDVGGIIKSTVSKNTDYLIVGIQDEEIVGNNGISSKEKKAYSLINDGIAINIIDESEFIKLLNEDAIYKTTRIIFDKPYIKFNSETDCIEFLRKYKLLSETATELKTFYYKDRDVAAPTVCQILGYEKEYSTSATLVIDYGYGACFILSDYLKEIQKSLQPQ